MNIRERAEKFALYVGLELKGKITSRGFTAKTVAESIKRQPAAFNRWLNGKVEIPMTVLCEACEFIDVDPSEIVEAAYDRVSVELGERDGSVYEEDEALITAMQSLAMADVVDPDEDVLVLSREEERALRKDAFDLAAKRGHNDADIPWAE